MYFWVFRNIKNDKLKMNLMGILAFWKSLRKHIKRRSPLWMITAQIKGMFMCIRQLLVNREKTKWQTK